MSFTPFGVSSWGPRATELHRIERQSGERNRAHVEREALNANDESVVQQVWNRYSSVRVLITELGSMGAYLYRANIAGDALCWVRSSSTVRIFTDPASPCLRISLSWFLLKSELQFGQFNVHSHSAMIGSTLVHAVSLSASGTSNASSNTACFATSITLFTACSMCQTHSHNA